MSEVIAAFQREGRTLARIGEETEPLPRVTRRSAANGQIHDVTAFALDSTTADEAIQEELTHFRHRGQTFEWKVFSFDTPPDLLDRLQAAGFTIGEQETMVVYDLADGLAPFEGPLPCEVRRIEQVDQLSDFRSVAEAVFKKDYSLTTNLLAEAILTGQPGHQAYVAYVDGEPVSVGRLYTDPRSQFAGLYGGGTRTEFRGQGCYRAIVAARARDAVAASSRYLLVDALPTSLPILLRVGFHPAGTTWPCTSPANA